MPCININVNNKIVKFEANTYKELLEQMKAKGITNPVAEIAKHIDQKNFEFLNNVLNSSIDVYGNMGTLSTMFFYLTNEEVEKFTTVNEILNPSKENPLSSSIAPLLKEFLTEFYEEKELDINNVSNLDIELQLNILRNRLSENFNISNTEISLKNDRSIEEITVALYIPIVRKFFNYFSKTQGNKDVLQSLLNTLDNYYLHKSTKSNTSTGEFFLDLRKQFDYYDDIKRTTGFRKTVTPDNLKLINGDFYSVQKLQINEDGTISITSDNAGYQKNIINNSRILNNNLKGNKPIEAVILNPSQASQLDKDQLKNLDFKLEAKDKIKKLTIELLKYHYPGKITKEIEEKLNNSSDFFTEVSMEEAILFKEFTSIPGQTDYRGLYYKYDQFTFEIPNVTNLVLKAFKNESDEEKINNIIKDFESTIKPGNKLKATPYSNYLELSKQNDKILLNYVEDVETKDTRVTRNPKLIDLAKDTKMVSMVNQSTKELVSVEAVSKQFVGMSNIIETIVKGQPFQEALKTGNAKIVDGVPFFKIAGKGRDYFIPYFYINANVKNMVAGDDNAVALEKAFLKYIQKVNNDKSIFIDNLRSLLRLESRDLLFSNKDHKSLLNVTLFYPDVILKRKEPKTLEEIESIIKTEEFTTSESTLGKLTLALAFNSAYEEKNLNYDLTQYNERISFLSSDDTSIDEVKQDNIFKNFLLNVNRGKEEGKIIKSEEDINNLAEEFKKLLKKISLNLDERNTLVSLNINSQNSLNGNYGTELLLALSAFDKIPVITENTVLGQEMLIPASPFLSENDFGRKQKVINRLNSKQKNLKKAVEQNKLEDREYVDKLEKELEVYKKLKEVNNLSKDEIKEVLSKLESYYLIKENGKDVFNQFTLKNKDRFPALLRFIHDLKQNKTFLDNEIEFFNNHPFLILGATIKNPVERIKFQSKNPEIIKSLSFLADNKNEVGPIVSYLMNLYHDKDNVNTLEGFSENPLEKAIEQINLEINIANTYTDQNVIRKSLADLFKQDTSPKEVIANTLDNKKTDSDKEELVTAIIIKGRDDLKKERLIINDNKSLQSFFIKTLNLLQKDLEDNSIENTNKDGSVKASYIKNIKQLEDLAKEIKSVESPQFQQLSEIFKKEIKDYYDITDSGKLIPKKIGNLTGKSSSFGTDSSGEAKAMLDTIRPYLKSVLGGVRKILVDNNGNNVPFVSGEWGTPLYENPIEVLKTLSIEFQKLKTGLSDKELSNVNKTFDKLIKHLKENSKTSIKNIASELENVKDLETKTAFYNALNMVNIGYSYVEFDNKLGVYTVKTANQGLEWSVKRNHVLEMLSNLIQTVDIEDPRGQSLKIFLEENTNLTTSFYKFFFGSERPINNGHNVQILDETDLLVIIQSFQAKLKEILQTEDGRVTFSEALKSSLYDNGVQLIAMFNGTPAKNSNTPSNSFNRLLRKISLIDNGIYQSTVTIKGVEYPTMLKVFPLTQLYTDFLYSKKDKSKKILTFLPEEVGNESTHITVLTQFAREDNIEDFSALDNDTMQKAQFDMWFSETRHIFGRKNSDKGTTQLFKSPINILNDINLKGVDNVQLGIKNIIHYELDRIQILYNKAKEANFEGTTGFKIEKGKLHLENSVFFYSLPILNELSFVKGKYFHFVEALFENQSKEELNIIKDKMAEKISEIFSSNAFNNSLTEDNIKALQSYLNNIFVEGNIKKSLESIKDIVKSDDISLLYSILQIQDWINNGIIKPGETKIEDILKIEEASTFENPINKYITEVVSKNIQSTSLDELPSDSLFTDANLKVLLTMARSYALGYSVAYAEQDIIYNDSSFVKNKEYKTEKGLLTLTVNGKEFSGEDLLIHKLTPDSLLGYATNSTKRNSNLTASGIQGAAGVEKLNVRVFKDLLIEMQEGNIYKDLFKDDAFEDFITKGKDATDAAVLGNLVSIVQNMASTGEMFYDEAFRSYIDNKNLNKEKDFLNVNNIAIASYLKDLNPIIYDIYKEIQDNLKQGKKNFKVDFLNISSVKTFLEESSFIDVDAFTNAGVFTQEYVLEDDGVLYQNGIPLSGQFYLLFDQGGINQLENEIGDYKGFIHKNNRPTDVQKLVDLSSLSLNSEQDVDLSSVKVSQYIKMAFINDAQSPFTSALQILSIITNTNSTAPKSAVKESISKPESLITDNNTISPNFFTSKNNLVVIKQKERFQQLDTSDKGKIKTTDSSQQMVKVWNDLKDYYSINHKGETASIKDLRESFTETLVRIKLIDLQNEYKQLDRVPIKVISIENKSPIAEFDLLQEDAVDIVYKYLQDKNVELVLSENLITQERLKKFLKDLSSGVVNKVDILNIDQLPNVENQIMAVFRNLLANKMPGFSLIQTPNVLGKGTEVKKQSEEDLNSSFTKVTYIPGKNPNEKLKFIRFKVKGKEIEFDLESKSIVLDEETETIYKELQEIYSKGHNIHNDVFINKLNEFIKNGDIEILPAEIIVPFKLVIGDEVKNLKNYLDEKGNLDLSKFDERLLYTTGFRIPYQASSSGIPLKIVGFTDDKITGASATISDGILITMGSDFDIDKLQIYFKNYEAVGKNIKLIEKELISENNTDLYKKFNSLRGKLKDYSDYESIITKEDFETILEFDKNFESYLINYKIKTKSLDKLLLQNELIDTLFSIYTSPFLTRDLLTPQENETVERVIKEQKEEEQVDLGDLKETDTVLNLIRNSYNTPFYQAKITDANLGAKKALGITVMGSIQATLAQLYSLSTQEKVNFRFGNDIITENKLDKLIKSLFKLKPDDASFINSINSENYSKKQEELGEVLARLDKIYGIDIEAKKGSQGYQVFKISDLFRQFINIAVDNGKDQKLGELGLSKENISYATGMTVLGIGLKSSMNFLKNPIVNTFIKEAHKSNYQGFIESPVQVYKNLIQSMLYFKMVYETSKDKLDSSDIIQKIDFLKFEKEFNAFLNEQEVSVNKLVQALYNVQNLYTGGNTKDSLALKETFKQKMGSFFRDDSQTIATLIDSFSNNSISFIPDLTEKPKTSENISLAYVLNNITASIKDLKNGRKGYLPKPKNENLFSDKKFGFILGSLSQLITLNEHSAVALTLQSANKAYRKGDKFLNDSINAKISLDNLISKKRISEEDINSYSKSLPHQIKKIYQLSISPFSDKNSTLTIKGSNVYKDFYETISNLVYGGTTSELKKQLINSFINRVAYTNKNLLGIQDELNKHYNILHSHVKTTDYKFKNRAANIINAFSGNSVISSKISFLSKIVQEKGEAEIPVYGVIVKKDVEVDLENRFNQLYLLSKENVGTLNLDESEVEAFNNLKTFVEDFILYSLINAFRGHKLDTFRILPKDLLELLGIKESTANSVKAFKNLQVVESLEGDAIKTENTVLTEDIVELFTRNYATQVVKTKLNLFKDGKLTEDSSIQLEFDLKYELPILKYPSRENYILLNVSKTKVPNYLLYKKDSELQDTFIPIERLPYIFDIKEFKNYKDTFIDFYFKYQNLNAESIIKNKQSSNEDLKDLLSLYTFDTLKYLDSYLNKKITDQNASTIYTKELDEIKNNILLLNDFLKSINDPAVYRRYMNYFYIGENSLNKVYDNLDNYMADLKVIFNIKNIKTFLHNVSKTDKTGSLVSTQIKPSSEKLEDLKTLATKYSSDSELSLFFNRLASIKSIEVEKVLQKALIYIKKRTDKTANNFLTDVTELLGITSEEQFLTILNHKDLRNLDIPLMLKIKRNIINKKEVNQMISEGQNLTLIKNTDFALDIIRFLKLSVKNTESTSILQLTENVKNAYIDLLDKALIEKTVTITDNRKEFTLKLKVERNDSFVEKSLINIEVNDSTLAFQNGNLSITKSEETLPTSLKEKVKKEASKMLENLITFDKKDLTYYQFAKLDQINYVSTLIDLLQEEFLLTPNTDTSKSFIGSTNVTYYNVNNIIDRLISLGYTEGSLKKYDGGSAIEIVFKQKNSEELFKFILTSTKSERIVNTLNLSIYKPTGEEQFSELESLKIEGLSKLVTRDDIFDKLDVCK